MQLAHPSRVTNHRVVRVSVVKNPVAYLVFAADHRLRVKKTRPFVAKKFPKKYFRLDSICPTPPVMLKPKKLNFMTTHIGKIARLPAKVREELNHRLQNGETGSVILPWLNALPAVQAVLASHFGAGPVNHQNLTNWRQGAYQHWLKQQACEDLVRELAENAGEFAPHGGAPVIANHLSTVLVADLAVTARDIRNEPAGPVERFERLKKMLHTVSEVRQQDYRAGRLALDRERDELMLGRSP
jgi:hypothetical protein